LAQQAIENVDGRAGWASRWKQGLGMRQQLHDASLVADSWERGTNSAADRP
jgi:hypothetical protein